MAVRGGKEGQRWMEGRKGRGRDPLRPSDHQVVGTRMVESEMPFGFPQEGA